MNLLVLVIKFYFLEWTFSLIYIYIYFLRPFETKNFFLWRKF